MTRTIDLEEAKRRQGHAQTIVNAADRIDKHFAAIQDELKTIRQALVDDAQPNYEHTPIDRLDAMIHSIRWDVFGPRFGSWRGFLAARQHWVRDLSCENRIAK